MSQQSRRQRARRAALSVTAKHRVRLLERAKGMEYLAVEVVTALGERDAALAETELRAGKALRAMTEGEGATLREAVAWCGDHVSMREATRLRALAPLEPTDVGRS